MRRSSSDAAPGFTGKGPPEALGESEALLAFHESVSRVARVDRPVLICGERGTGKELVATRLHYLSFRWQNPLVTLNCAVLAPSLLETELFGHEPGAFTGATQRREGRFEAANEGTLFLDEIGLLPMQVQEKILRVVEYGTFERVGSSAPINVNVRIIGATNANLPALVAQGTFKADLLDRLAFEVLTLPPLRERYGDVMLLARYFAARMALELGREEAPAFSDEAVATLEGYAWPGNVRELKNVVERAVYRCTGDTIDAIEFNPFPAAEAKTAETGIQASDSAPADHSNFIPGRQSLPEAVRDLELKALRRALAQSRHHQSEAARLLGLTYHQFRALYRKHKGGMIEESGANAIRVDS